MTVTFKRLILTLSSLVLALAIQPGSARAAASAAPVFGPAEKLFSGQITVPGGKNVVTDGNNFYIAMVTDDGNNGRNEIRIARLPNSGKAPEVTGIALAKPYGVLTDELSLAVSDSSSSTGRKTVHLVWRQQAEDQAGLFYSWTNEANLDKWSAPVRINGKSSHCIDGTIVVNKKGDKHVIFIGDGPKMYYTKAASGSSNFSEPVALPGHPFFDNRSVDTALDPGGTLHVAFIATEEASYEPSNRFGLQYTNFKQSTKKWSSPKEVIPIATISDRGNINIAASDPKVLYIASSLVNRVNLDVYKSENGGSLWKKSTVSRDRPHNDPSIAVAHDKSVTVGSGFTTTGEGEQEARIFRSSDGVTWSPAAVIPNRTSVIVALDIKGKAAVFASGSTGLNDDMKYVYKEQ
jgi:hypothetical protein